MNEPRLYSELAEWWPLLSPPAHYTEEAKELIAILEEFTTPAHRTLLELGAGGGSLASHLKQRFVLTLTDRSEGMLAVSRAVNPDCEHVAGDMRRLRLEREFDVVLMHDAIAYAQTRTDVVDTLRTAWSHCRRGGVVVIMPDYVKETFHAGTDHGGEDGADGRGLRYLEWTFDSDSTDDAYDVVFAFLLRHANGSVTVEGDEHRCGLFSHDTWLDAVRQIGFEPRTTVDSYGRTLFIGSRAPGPQ